MLRRLARRAAPAACRRGAELAARPDPEQPRCHSDAPAEHGANPKSGAPFVRAKDAPDGLKRLAFVSIPLATPIPLTIPFVAAIPLVVLRLWRIVAGIRLSGVVCP